MSDNKVTIIDGFSVGIDDNWIYFTDDLGQTHFISNDKKNASIREKALARMLIQLYNENIK